MTTTIALLVFGIALGVIGPRWLDRCAWPTRSPSLGILAWQTMTVTVFVSFVWAGVTIVAHAMPESGWIGKAVHGCSVLLSEEGALEQSPLVPALGALLSLGFVSALLGAVQLGWRRQRSQLRRQKDLLGVLCAPHREPDVLVLDHQVPSVFCLPGGRSARVVVSRGALDVLTDRQFQQVLAHERAHLASRHHLILRWADAFEVVLRGRLGSGESRARIAELVEMHADDAAGSVNRRDLAEAVIALAGGAHPVGALGAGGSAMQRVRRLSAPAAPVSARARGAVLLALSMLVLAPGVIALTPGLAELFGEACPFVF